ncbi:hypothetical protein GCM10027093_70400 [Paraburkholderia jirisanensis]|jgi:uncharacterized tellurite resistance protein B-like protein
MRTYPRNSPEAAARIVALALTADGHVCSSEDRALDRLNVSRELGLAPGDFPRIVQTLCEDRSLAPASTWIDAFGDIEPDTLATLMNEVDDPALRRKVLRLCVAVAVADDYLADGEIALLAALLEAWRPHRTAIAM